MHLSIITNFFEITINLNNIVLENFVVLCCKAQHRLQIGVQCSLYDKGLFMLTSKHDKCVNLHFLVMNLLL